jgi:hypothetical protein
MTPGADRAPGRRDGDKQPSRSTSGFLDERRPVEDDEQACAIDGCWLVMTVAFEPGFGRAVAKEPWEDLPADYNVARGRLWPLVLAWIGVGPAVTRTLRIV